MTCGAANKRFEFSFQVTLIETLKTFAENPSSTASTSFHSLVHVRNDAIHVANDCPFFWNPGFTHWPTIRKSFSSWGLSSSEVDLSAPSTSSATALARPTSNATQKPNFCHGNFAMQGKCPELLNDKFYFNGRRYIS
jgi:hypothetical protein